MDVTATLTRAAVSPVRLVPTTVAAGTEPSRLRQVAHDFEAMAIGALLRPMFDTVDSAHGAFGGGEAEATWRPMLVDAMARKIADHGGLGLAQPVFASLLNAQEAAGGQR